MLNFYCKIFSYGWLTLILVATIITSWEPNRQGLNIEKGIQVDAACNSYGIVLHWRSEQPPPESFSGYWDVFSHIIYENVYYDNIKWKAARQRLISFLYAVQLEAKGRYSDAFAYLVKAQAGERLSSSAHPYYWKKDYACFLFLSELGNLVNGEIPIENGLALSLLSDKVSASQVADAYRRLLLYSPNNLVFQRILQKALEAGNLNK